MNRRSFLSGAALAGLTGCAPKNITRVAARGLPPYGILPKLMPIRAQVDRIFRVTVCVRPFRAAGPRLDVERVGEHTVVHNYGHGGSGWSLSWGSSSIAVEKAMTAAAGDRNIAVIGCGVLGLTSALLAQRAGARVTIYTKERPPDVRSARATGSWTPDSRITLANSAAADFPALWEKMARTSFHMFESYLGMAGNPVEWIDRYTLSDGPPAGPPRGRGGAGSLEFGRYQDRIADITPLPQEMPPGTHPFPTKFARRNSSLQFNVAGYSRQMVTDFLIAGGRIETMECRTPADLTRLTEKVIIHATGYGARALWKDETLVPVRGQIAWLIPQPEVTYGLNYRNLNIVSRRDGIVIQDVGNGEMTGYNEDNEVPDRGAAESAVRAAADLFGRMKW